MAVNYMLFADFQLHHISFLGVTPASGNPTTVLANLSQSRFLLLQYFHVVSSRIS